MTNEELNKVAEVIADNIAPDYPDVSFETCRDKIVEGVKEGWLACKKQMLKDAVEGWVSSTKGDHFGCVTSVPTDLGKLYGADKCKIIIVKEDEK